MPIGEAAERTWHALLEWESVYGYGPSIRDLATATFRTTAPTHDSVMRLLATKMIEADHYPSGQMIERSLHTIPNTTVYQGRLYRLVEWPDE